MRWKERHQIHFSFGKMTNVSLKEGRTARMREVNLQLPMPYSHRMQIYAADADSISVDLEKECRDGASGYLIPALNSAEWLCIMPTREGGK